jgi:hypothetical protein
MENKAIVQELTDKAIANGKKKYERFHTITGGIFAEFETLPVTLRETWIRFALGGKVKPLAQPGVGFLLDPPVDNQPTSYKPPDWSKIEKAQKAEEKRIKREIAKVEKKNKAT